MKHLCTLLTFIKSNQVIKSNFNFNILCKRKKVKESLATFCLYHLMIQYYIYLSFLYIYNICIYRLINTCDIFSLIGYFEQYMEYDPFLTQPELTNPWISDSPEMWEQEKLAYVYY